MNTDLYFSRKIITIRSLIGNTPFVSILAAETVLESVTLYNHHLVQKSQALWRTAESIISVERDLQVFFFLILIVEESFLVFN